MRMMHRIIPPKMRRAQIIHTGYPLKQGLVENSVENVDNLAVNGCIIIKRKAERAPCEKKAICGGKNEREHVRILQYA